MAYFSSAVSAGEQNITLAYDHENHLTSISGSGISATYVYDGDGKRVKATVGSTNTVYIGNIYERDNGSTVRKYYYAGSVRVAMRTGGQTYYLLNDHLTSTAITTNSAGVRQTELRYFAYGGTRYDPGSQMTIYRYTGQRIETGTGLYDYGSRWYDPQIGRFLAADTIVPNPGDSQSLNRYMYVTGNPMKYSDPSGHANECGATGSDCGGPPRPGNTNSQPAQPAQPPTSTPTATPPGCNSVVCLPTSTPTSTPTGTPRPGPNMSGITPTPTPTATATPWPYTPSPGSINVPDLEFSAFMALMVDMPETLAKKGMTQGGSTLVRALGRGGQILGGPVGPLAIGAFVSVAPNVYQHAVNHDPLRDGVTDFVVDGAGWVVSSLAGVGAAGVAGFLFSETVVAAVPAAVIANLGASAGASIAWDLYIAPEIVRPMVYQEVSRWVH